MNAMIGRLIEVPPAPLKLMLKGAFGLGMLALFIVGAIFFLLEKDYTVRGQAITAVIGALVGALSAWRVSKLSSGH